MQKKKLGALLVEAGHLSEEELNRAIAVQQSKSIRLGEALLESGKVSKKDIGVAIEKLQGVPYAECPPDSISPEVLARIPHALAIRCTALPLEIRDRQLVMAMAEPQNLEFLDELKFRADMKVSPRFSFREDILEGIRKFYGEGDPEKSVAAQLMGDDELSSIEFFTSSTREENREALRELQAGKSTQTPAVRYVSKILSISSDRGASDIHIEPRLGSTVVRTRVDGMLNELLSIPQQYSAAVVSRIKILADMDIAERRVPQDGRFLIQFRGRRLDLRVSTLPTHFGEKVVMRILDPQSTLIGLDQLGFSEAKTAALDKILSLPQGMLIVTGPTGSGKSTTLYAALNRLATPSRNIITVEDPIEYMIEGINQVQVNTKAGLTFAGCLRSMLRQDPDVIMVGEVRDGETAEIALQASQTGHLVLSTLHTNDSIGAITRLLDLEVPNYLVATSVSGALAQRLVRRLCQCRQMVPPNAPLQGLLAGLQLQNTNVPLYQPVGCSLCDKTGYKGRVGIYELLVFDEQIRTAIHLNATPEEIRVLADSTDFQTMQEDALEKVKGGLTTLSEVLRGVPFARPAKARSLDQDAGLASDASNREALHSRALREVINVS